MLFAYTCHIYDYERTDYAMQYIFSDSARFLQCSLTVKGFQMKDT